MSQAPTPPQDGSSPEPSADAALSMIQEKLKALQEKKAAEKAKVEFAERPPEEVRKYLQEQIEKGQPVDQELAAKILAHAPADPIDIPGIEAAIAEKMTADQIIDTLITDINREERYNVFNTPDKITVESANQRKIAVEALAKREGIVVQIILQQAATQPEKAADLLTKFVRAMKDSDPKAVPPGLGIELAQRFDGLSRPQAKATTEQLRVIFLFKDVPSVNEVIPGYAEIQTAAEVKIVGIEATEKAETQARQALEKETKHQEREKTLEADTVDGAMETARDNLKNQRHIAFESGTRVALKGREEPFDCHLEIIFNNPLIKKALEARELIGYQLTYPLGQLEALLTIQNSADLRDEAIKTLSETVKEDWTGWEREDYKKAEQEGRWNEVWQNHLERTFYGYALGMIESAVNFPLDSPYAQSRNLIIERGMDILLGDVSFIELEVGESTKSINQRYGKGTNRARAVTRLANDIIARIGDEGFGTPELLENILESEALGDRSRISGIKNKLAELLESEEGRKGEEAAAGKRFTELLESTDGRLREIENIVAKARGSENYVNVIVYFQNNPPDPNDFLEIKEVKAHYETEAYQGKKVKTKAPVIRVRQRKVDELLSSRHKNQEELTREKQAGRKSEKVAALERNIASIDVQLKVIDELRRACLELQKHNTYIDLGTKKAFIDSYPFRVPIDETNYIQAMAIEGVRQELQKAKTTYGDLIRKIAGLKAEVGASSQRRQEIESEIKDRSSQLIAAADSITNLSQRFTNADKIKYISQRMLKLSSEGNLEKANDTIISASDTNIRNVIID
jgi:hypothetical protein